MCRVLIPGPIWKMSCNDLFITYFQAEKMRIYVKHNFNMNIFRMNNPYHCSPLNICWLTIELTISCLVYIPKFSVIVQEQNMARYWVNSGAGMSSTTLRFMPHCNHPKNIFRSLFFFFFLVLLFFISTINWFVTSLETCRNVCIVCCVAGCHLCLPLPIWQILALRANSGKWVLAIIGHAKQTYSFKICENYG